MREYGVKKDFIDDMEYLKEEGEHTMTLSIYGFNSTVTIPNFPASIRVRNYNPCFDEVVEPAVKLTNLLVMYDGHKTEDGKLIMDRAESPEVFDFLSR